MSWSKLHGGAHRHLKVTRLAKALGCSVLEARGLVLTLWSWTVETEPDGNLSAYGTDELAVALGVSEEQIDALVDVGLLDRSEGSMHVHEWDDYAGSWKEAERLREHRRSKVKRTRTVRVPNINSTRTELVGERRGEERSREEKRLRDNLGSAADGSSEAPSSPVVLSLSLTGGRTQPITEDDLARWSIAFPGADVAGELAKMASWLDANPTRRPKSSVKAFAHRWLTRAQNDAANRAGASRTSDRENATQFALRLAREERAREAARADTGQLRLAPGAER